MPKTIKISATKQLKEKKNNIEKFGIKNHR